MTKLSSNEFIAMVEDLKSHIYDLTYNEFVEVKPSIDAFYDRFHDFMYLRHNNIPSVRDKYVADFVRRLFEEGDGSDESN